MADIVAKWASSSSTCSKFLRNFHFTYSLIVAIYMGAIIALLGFLSVNNYLTPGDFALVFMVNYKIVDMLYEISGKFREFMSRYATAKVAIELLEKKIEVVDVPGAKDLVISNSSIRFENVSFNYEESEKLFDGISVTIGSGEKVGIVGYSGSGGTSFINLIMRLYEVSDGQIFINGQDINNVIRDSLYKV